MKSTDTIRSRRNSRSRSQFISAIGITALQEKYFNAVYTRNISDIKQCLAKGVNPNAVNPTTGTTPLHVLAERDDSVLGFRLINETTDINLDKKSGHGLTALQLACLFNNKRFVIMLLQMGADPNIREEVTDRTALHFAVLKGSFPIVYQLLKFQADPNMMDTYENTPFFLSLVVSPNFLIANILLKYGVNISLEEKKKSSLHVFFECILGCHTQNQIDYVTFLLDSGVDVNVRDRVSQRMCLHFVAITGYVDLAVVLVQRGADLLAVDKLGRTPLMVAQEHRNTFMVNFFEKGRYTPVLLAPGPAPLARTWTRRLRMRIAERKAREETNQPN